MWLDALHEKMRIDNAVTSYAVVIAYGVTASGFRDVIAIEVVDTESKESWTTFLRELRKRGLTGTKLVSNRRTRRPQGGDCDSVDVNPDVDPIPWIVFGLDFKPPLVLGARS